MAAALSLIAVGGFGERTAQLLSAQFTGSAVLSPDDVEQAFGTVRGTVVLTAQNPAPRLCERLDNLAYRFSRPWLPVVMDNSVVRVGPLIRPPYGPCFRCFQGRRAQHDREAAATALLHHSYDAGQQPGPGGFLPHHARLAAAVAATCLRAVPEAGAPDGPDDGIVTTIRLREWGIDRNHVVPRHSCPRCGPSAPVREAIGDSGPGRLRAALGPVRTAEAGR
ncbi:TOMM precursor leader peptide-binding protein [Streptomyces scopuliridis]|uniref:Bacteriocin biosynthesis cyclodehydratase domain-containing protein n=1 Tax=Streptomyces scopuliridis RB72 TaxID=1440053 RepID=A0A2T7T6K6_9ACTN|nr:TOMM precursor leader peptide-binding protein [Streptomyces scopuliridis]PVE10731.1 hypothetical protein Y717_26065 [Streptomyces scopuliridis RB72]